MNNEYRGILNWTGQIDIVPCNTQQDLDARNEAIAKTRQQILETNDPILIEFIKEFETKVALINDDPEALALVLNVIKAMHK